MQPSDHALIVDQLTKNYNSKTAVNSMNLVVEDHEVFGLLGPNGAGKTTLISMITGVHPPTSGDCRVAGFSVLEDIEKVHTSIGVCPQFDILWPELTVEEHLYFYCRLRGTPRKKEVDSVEQTLKEINLQEFRHLKTN